MTRRLVVISAGLSQPSSTRLLADQLGAAVSAQVTARGEEVQVQTIELRDLAVDLATFMATGLPPASVDAARAAVDAADGLVVVTPVFAASYSGLFKMFFDTLDQKALTGMPVLVAATAGSPRHSMVLDHALRPLMTHLHAVVMPTGVFAATEDFGGGEQGRSLTTRISRAAGELAAYLVRSGSDSVEGFTPSPTDRAGRSSGIDVPSTVTPFSSLLRGHAG